ncbi:hypothetical protein ACFQL1_07855 [Halomicroarcula sp. GCM10025709]|uniref:hypothetical protein n=1 Tax=Halomicroarcula sp. GCM10025709 TaxID=3252669 RepID=UPI00360C54CD
MVPLAVPAAVGAVTICHWGAQALESGDGINVALSIMTVLLVAVLVGSIAVSNVYVNETADENPLVQYAQPDNGLTEHVETINRIAQFHESGPDVLFYYGETEYDDRRAFVEADQSTWDSSAFPHRYHCIRWYNSLPLGWYFRTDDVAISCERDRSELSDRASAGTVPVIVTQYADRTVPAQQLRQAGYDRRGYYHRAGGRWVYTSVWVHPTYAQNSTS